MDNDKILRVYAQLKSIKENLANAYQISEKYIHQYHSLVDALSQATGSNLDDFRIAAEELRPELIGIDSETGRHKYSSERYCEKAMFFSKVDALLSYFEIRYLSGEKRRIGFSPPE